MLLFEVPVEQRGGAETSRLWALYVQLLYVTWCDREEIAGLLAER